MNKIYKNEKGFTAVEGLLIVLILVVIGAVGYMVYHNDHKTKVASVSTAATKSTTSTKTTTTTTSPNPYAGWQSYTLAQEKLTFKYPTTWTLKDMSDSNDDYEVLSGPNNFSMTIGAGAAVSAINVASGPIEQADQVTFTGKTGYLDSVSSGTSTSSPVYEALLSQSATTAGDFFPTKNITFNASNSRILVKIDYWGSNDDTSNTEPLSYVQNDVNYKDAKLVVNSMSY